MDRLAILFGFLTLGAFKESFSMYEETGHNRAALYFGLAVTATCLFLHLNSF